MPRGQTMARRVGFSGNSIGLLFLPLLIGCDIAAPHTRHPLGVWNTVPSSIQVPITIERLAILYPKTYNRIVMDAYARLEGAAFQLKEERPRLRIVDRFHLPTIMDEQRLQLGGTVSEQTAISVGRLLGVDSVLLFNIEGPTVRDHTIARFTGDLAPFTLTSKIIRVESAEVVFHNVVTSRVETFGGWMPPVFSDSHMPPVVRAAVDRGVAQTIADLRHAFRVRVEER